MSGTGTRGETGLGLFLGVTEETQKRGTITCLLLVYQAPKHYVIVAKPTSDIKKSESTNDFSNF